LNLLLGVGNEFEDVIGIVNDFEVETPIPVDPGLPAIVRFVILLWRAKRDVGDSEPGNLSA
jgi:hypothetical protein